MDTHRATLARPRIGRRPIRAAVGLLTAVLTLASAVLFDPGRVTSAAPVGAGFVLTAEDLRFIRTQISIAEAHTATGPAYLCSALLGTGADQVGSPVLPYGLRTVDGTCNNLQPGQENFGSADEVFPRLLDEVYRTADPDPGLFGPPGSTPTSYTAKKGAVYDAEPRIASNLVVDQTSDNPAAVEAGGHDCESLPSGETCFIPNVAPDGGLSAPFNSVFTFFGQFFDHGLDLVSKGGSGTVYMPLQPDDPLYETGSPTNFMPLTRATNLPGPDGIVGDPDPAAPDTSLDDIQESTNTTTPFVDQNQTYTSHPSHQVFLRAYTGNPPLPTGKLIDGVGGNIGTWADIKTQAATVLGIELTDVDVLNVPKLVTDPYGHFVPGPNGFPQVEFPVGPPQEGNPTAPVSVAGSIRTGHAFLDDIAHNAAPSATKTADGDSDISSPGDSQPSGTYDDELLNRHFITGDGRGNENIGLTAIHTVFHSEHNRLADEIGGTGGLIDTLLTPAEQADWQAVNPASGWGYGERIFQAARLVTEMQYQHLVFEEFARKVQPQVNVFSGYHTEINPAISAEFAHTVYRFGHSMLNEEVARTAADEVTENNIDLFEAFLNPVAFNDGGLTADQAVGAIIRGSSRQVGNEIDEFVTDVLRNRLVGLPLDLPAVNMARGRSEGIPSLNAARRQFHATSGHPELAPYASWADLWFNLKHPETLPNLVAAYGTHTLITTLDPDGPGGDGPGSLEGRRIAADILLTEDPWAGPDGILGDPDSDAPDTSLDDVAPPADSLDFVLGQGTWANAGGVTVTGVDDIDYWLGGLAEKQSPFGGLLGTTFNYVFETQLEQLQDGDRFYYLTRLAGHNLLVQLEGNSLAELIMRNSDVEGLPADVFSRPDFIFRMKNLGASGPILDDATTPDWNENLLLTRNVPTAGTVRFGGPEHVVFNGVDTGTSPPVNDRMFSSEGDDTIRGNGGADWVEGGAGNDNLIGGLGNDLLNDSFGDDVIKGGPGNDAIASGPGFDLNQGGTGDDFVVGGSDPTETFGGGGNDLIFAGESADTVFGGNASDWIEGGTQADLLQGDNGFPFQDDPTGGHDVIIGDGGNDDYDAEGGDDVMVAGPGIERNEGMLGFDWVTHRGDPQAANADMAFTGLLPPDVNDLRDRYDLVEGLSGWQFNDTLRGDSLVAADLVGHRLTAAGVTRVAGLGDIVTAPFDDGNIILGGAGSDLIEGKGGNDIIDGDRWLNVQLSDGTATFDSMMALRARVFAGTLDPGAISIVRSIVTTGVQPTDIDTVQYSGPPANYTLTFNGDGSVTITDTVGLDGTDTVRNVERIVYCLVPGPDPGSCATLSAPAPLINNAPPTGVPVLSTTTPTEGEAVTVSTAGIADADGLPAVLNIQWQQSAAGGAAPFADIAGATSASFTPTPAQVNRALQVVVSYTDNGGTPETVTSAPTIVTGDLFVGGNVIDTFNGTAGRDNAQGNGGNDTLNLAGGPDLGSGGAGVDTINGAAGDDTLDGNGGADTLNGGGDNDTLNGGADADTLNGNAGLDTLNGDAGTDTLNGGADNDTLNGGADIDTLNGDAGDDTLTGGAGNDTMNGGGDNDTFVFAGANFGADVVNGFDANATGGQDRLNIAAYGVTAGNFATRVTLAPLAGGRTLVTVRNGANAVVGTISVNGGPANFDITDFVVA